MNYRASVIRGAYIGRFPDQAPVLWSTFSLEAPGTSYIISLAYLHSQSWQLARSSESTFRKIGLPYSTLLEILWFICFLTLLWTAFATVNKRKYSWLKILVEVAHNRNKRRFLSFSRQIFSSCPSLLFVTHMSILFVYPCFAVITSHVAYAYTSRNTYERSWARQ